jgi:hypothetical protein
MGIPGGSAGGTFGNSASDAPAGVHFNQLLTIY